MTKCGAIMGEPDYMANFSPALKWDNEPFLSDVKVTLPAVRKCVLSNDINFRSGLRETDWHKGALLVSCLGQD